MRALKPATAGEQGAEIDRGYLTLTRISGDTDQLVDFYRRSSEVMSEVGRDHGLIVHVAATTDEGMLIVNLWPSEDGSQAAARDPRRLGVIQQGGIKSEQIRPVHHQVVNCVVFE